ncbi:MAG: branched-chain amino acid ABC transporter permease [Lachnospiraceae bacterium]|nr:branched-chain amino acid ABC transporter permease [Lachnospiraceae bacterium]
MPEKMKKNYFINLIGIILVFLVMMGIFDTGILGAKTNYIMGIAIIAMMTVIIVCSLNLLTGYMGEFSLGHAGFMSVGAYSSAAVTMAMINAGITLPTVLYFIIAIIVGGIFSAFVGFIVGIPALRLRGDYLAIVTVAFAEIVRVAFTNFQITGGGKTLSGIPKVSDYHYIYIVMVICVALMYMYVRSRFGRAVIAIREDYIAAAASGINVTYYKVMTFVLSAFFAGVAGAIYSHYLTAIIPTFFNFMKSSEFLTMVILGGSGSLTGSIIGAAVLAALPEALRDFQIYRMLMYSVVLVIIMIFKPSGIFGTWEFSLPRVLNRVFGKNQKKGGAAHE